MTTAAPARAAADLPAGWRRARLGDVATLNPRREPTEIPEDRLTSFVPMAAVDERAGAIVDRLLRPFSEVRKGYTYFEEGDVLFAKITPCMQNGKHAIACGLEGGFGFGTTEFHVIRPGETVTAEWLHYYLRQRSILAEAVRHFTGAVGQQRVPDSFLAALRMPVPPLAEQRRIAAVLDEQMAAIERARTAAEQQLAAARGLPAAYLRAVFESDEARAWPVRPLGELCDGRGQYGTSQKLSSEPTGVPVLRMGNIQDGSIDWTDIRFLEAPEGETSPYMLQVGDVIINRTNSAELVGKTALFGGEREAAFASYLIRFRTRREVLDAAFLNCYMKTALARRFVADNLTRAIGQVNISASTLARLPVPVPALAEQHGFVADFNERATVVRAMTGALEEGLVGLRSASTASLRTAFAGELVRQPARATEKRAQGIYFKRGAIASYIVERLHQRPTFGRVQLEKLLYLAETYVGVDLEGTYRREAAGPYDSQLYKLENLAAKQGWFERWSRRGGTGYLYKPGRNIASRSAAAEAILGDRAAAMDTIITEFSKMNTERAEIVTTLFAAWNDFLIDGAQHDNDAVVEEVRHRWHHRKERFSPATLRGALEWMRREGVVPSGIGPHTVAKNG